MDAKIPVVSVGKTDGARLRTASGPATLRVEAVTQNIKSCNVIAQTRTGSTSDVVMVGAHLDSVPEAGPNDNATASRASY